MLEGSPHKSDHWATGLRHPQETGGFVIGNIKAFQSPCSFNNWGDLFIHRYPAKTGSPVGVG